MIRTSLLCVILFCVHLISAPRVSGQELRFAGDWTNVFAGSEITVTIESDSPGRRLAWSLSSNRRTLARGEVQAAEKTELVIRLPEVNEGVVLAAELRVSSAGTSVSKPLYLFPRKPFFGNTEWLTELGIALFDPNGETAERFLEDGIPFQAISTPVQIKAIETGFIVVGEGVSHSKYRNLMTQLLSASRRELPVLCLAPGDGRWMPGESQSELTALTLRQADVIGDLDKRLDHGETLGETTWIATRAELSSYRGRVAFEFQPDAGWPWLETRVADGGPLLITGFSIIASWEETPTARFCFARLLEHLDSARDHHSLTQSEESQ